MRPINKGAGGGWTPSATISWNKYNNQHQVTAAWKALSVLMNDTSSPLVLQTDDCLQLILDIITGHKTGADVTQYGKTAITAIRDKTSEIYKTADVYLAAAIGFFCAYCETNVSGKIEVDHQANEANYPTYICTWDNFLPSCGPCNNTKKAKPSRAALAVDPPPPALDPSSNDDGPFFAKLGEEWGWPDIYDWTYQYYWLDFQYSNDGGMSWDSLSYYEASDVVNVSLDEADIINRTVTANVRANGNDYVGVRVQVVVQPVGENLVDMCGLNMPGNPESTYDRRLYNRTVAWFDALTAMSDLPNCETENDVLAIWPGIQVASKATGFWSLWVTLLSQWTDRADYPHSLGYWLFMSGNAETFYPGTVTTNIQLPPM